MKAHYNVHSRGTPWDHRENITTSCAGFCGVHYKCATSIVVPVASSSNCNGKFRFKHKECPTHCNWASYLSPPCGHRWHSQWVPRWLPLAAGCRTKGESCLHQWTQLAWIALPPVLFLPNWWALCRFKHWPKRNLWKRSDGLMSRKNWFSVMVSLVLCYILHIWLILLLLLDFDRVAGYPTIPEIEIQEYHCNLECLNHTPSNIEKYIHIDFVTCFPANPGPAHWRQWKTSSFTLQACGTSSCLMGRSSTCSLAMMMQMGVWLGSAHDIWIPFSYWQWHCFLVIWVSGDHLAFLLWRSNML